MSTKHALLGLLCEGPSYAYKLTGRLEQRVGPAWVLNSGQISKAIRGMEEQGLVERVPDGIGVHRRRHVVSITEAGEREFGDWIEAVLVAVKLSRRPELLKVTVAGRERFDTALRHIDAYEESCVRGLNELRKVQSLIPPEATPVRADHVLLRLNLSTDIALLETELQSARDARDTLLWLHAQPDALWPSTAGRSSSTPAGKPSPRQQVFKGMAAKRLAPPGRERLTR